MESNDFIHILEQTITGINNPMLTLVASIDIIDYKLIIYSGKEKVDEKDIIITPHGDNKKIILRAKLPNNKRVRVYLITKDKKYKICSLKNSKLKRGLNKIIYIIKRPTVAILKKIKLLFRVLKNGIRFMWKEYHFLVPPTMWKKYLTDFINRMKSGSNEYYNPFNRNDYNKWLKKNYKLTEYEKQKYEPLISILIPVYNIGRDFLSECLDSILNQNYKNFEVCLVDDCSTLEETKETLEEYKKKDKRIRVKYRKENGHISNTTNDALHMAKGEFVALVDDDDLLTEDALFENILALNKDKTLDFIYSDEDKLSTDGVLCDPNFKPDYSPDTLLSHNYICHFSVLRKKIVEEVGGFTVGLEGAQDHDLFLKVVEKTNKIHHIRKVLYHWRMVEGSTSMTIDNKSYAVSKAKQAIDSALKRRKIKGYAVQDEYTQYHRVVYEYDKEPLISIIIPTRDYKDITKKCVDSIYEKTTYKNFEIIVANNDSKEKETLDFFKEYENKYKNFKVVDCIMDFNYSKINNIAVSKSKGEYIVLLNNDTEIISPDWLNIMVGYAMQKHIGTVGIKLLYPDMTVQHAGVILGLGGVASHAYIGASRDEIGMYARLRVPFNYAANTAACLMVSRKKFDEVNGLEETLMVAYNDIDFNLKLLEKGYYNVTLPQLEALHYESKSRGLDTTSAKYQRFIKESDYMWKKWGKLLNDDPYYNPAFSKKMSFMQDR